MMVTVIYKIINSANNKCYVGSTNNQKKRFRTHLSDLRKGIHHSIKLQHSFQKYGESNFKFAIIESFDFISKEVTLQREQYSIDTLKPEYNICLVAGSQLGVKRTDDFRKACSVRMKGVAPWNKGEKTGRQSPEMILKRSQSLTGRKRPIEFRRAMSEIRKGKTLSEIQKQKMREAKLKGTKNNKPVFSIDDFGNKTEYLGTGDASRKSGWGLQSIYDSINQKQKKWVSKKKQGLRWAWKTETN